MATRHRSPFESQPRLPPAFYSHPGDFVLDPFAGSGTTGRIALPLGRRPIVIEREGQYVAEFTKRFGAGNATERNRAIARYASERAAGSATSAC